MHEITEVRMKSSKKAKKKKERLCKANTLKKPKEWSFYCLPHKDMGGSRQKNKVTHRTCYLMNKITNNNL